MHKLTEIIWEHLNIMVCKPKDFLGIAMVKRYKINESDINS